ncbi:DUF5872 domain-containing protein [Micromonospora sp. NPDC049903]|uniref:DUF5872 domain-containing protein n=1 Tax=Micromonospora sp. NPDC049903 TaxID=3364276 RepID=UPI003788367F
MARYTKPELREQIKAEIMASDRGGRPGQWSARKSQLLTKEYERRGGGFLGPKDSRQRSLERWGAEKWQTSTGSTRARKGDETARYLPKKAWEKLSDEQKRDTDTKKRRASRTGRQFVANTGPAKRARKETTSPRGRAATSAERLTELTVPEASRLVPGLDKNQLRAALRRERGGKARKTLLQRLQSELDRR